jgi:HAE1 family hydrophobic/amphiphilic exporter-1
MTLLALTLDVGIVIDDAIVVLENIVRYLHEKRYEPRAAAIEATKEITLAVLATTLSLVIIFLPIAFMSGYARRYVNQFGWTMAFSILVSMLVSFTLTPMLSSRLLRRPPEGSSAHEKEWPFFAWIDARYGRILRWSLDHRKVVVLMAAGTFLLVFPLNYLVGRDWIPPDDQGELSAILNLPEGSSLDATVRVSTDLAKKISALKGVEFVNPYVHEGAILSHSHIYVKLVDLSQRSFTNLDAAADTISTNACTNPARRSY